jgi:hypothetical protein
VLEVGTVTSVDGDGGPSVGQNTNFRASGVDHGLNSENHAGLEAGAFAGAAKVGDLGIFVHGTADSVAYELADDTETLSFAEVLDGGGYIAEAPADLTLLNSSSEGGLGDVEELLGGGGDLANGVGDGGVGVVTVDDAAAVDGEDVAFFEDALFARDSRGIP